MEPAQFPTWILFATAVIVGLIYCLPLIIAQMRGHPRRARITLVNLLLGWTVLGWIGALVWSVLPVRPGRS